MVTLRLSLLIYKMGSLTLAKESHKDLRGLYEGQMGEGVSMCFTVHTGFFSDTFVPLTTWLRHTFYQNYCWSKRRDDSISCRQ